MPLRVRHDAPKYTQFGTTRLARKAARVVNLPSLNSVDWLLGILGIAAILVGWGRGWLESPKRRTEREQNKAVADAILGEAAVKDRNDNVITPGQPGLVHRVTTVEEAVVEFRHMVGLLTETQHTLSDHGARIKALEDARVERLVTQAESAHMWRAVADNAAADKDRLE